jgi:hypothetical protein
VLDPHVALGSKDKGVKSGNRLKKERCVRHRRAWNGKLLPLFFLSGERDERSRYSDYTTDWTVRVSNPGRDKREISVSQNVRMGSGVHSVLCSMGTGGKRRGA